MPKKPKHIQDRVDQLIQEKQTAKEIITTIKNEGHTVSESYISSRRGKIKEPEENKESGKTLLGPELNKESIQLLFNLMNMLGEDNLDYTVKTISEDYKTILKEKYKHDLDNQLTVAQVFNQFAEVYTHPRVLLEENELKIHADDERLTMSNLDEKEDIFIINLSRNYPSRGYSLLQQLRNGVPTWSVSNRLKMIYPDYIVQSIVNELNKQESKGKVFQVNISKNRENQVSVFPLTSSVLPLLQEVL